MKTLKLLLCSSLLVLSSSIAFGQSWLWGEGAYGDLKSDGVSLSVATDKKGNAYITGRFSPTVIFGSDTLSTLSTSTTYLTKYNSLGNAIWAKQLNDNPGSSSGNSVTVDKAGNPIITGSYYGTATLGAFTLTGVNNTINSNTFVVKYNAAGTVIWAKQSTLPAGNSFGNAYSVTTDKFGNIFIGGSFKDTIIFGSDTLKTSFSNNTNTFIVKYDSNGNVLWAKQSTSSTTIVNSAGTPSSVITDNFGNAYLTGYFSFHLTFGTFSINAPVGLLAAFLIKYSPSGNVLLAKQSISGSTNSFCAPISGASDNAGDIYLTGYFHDTAQFGAHIIYSLSGYSAFLTKFDTNGNVIWVEQSSVGWLGTGLTSDTINHIYMAGISENATIPDTLTFGALTLHYSPLEHNASFIEKFDTNGNPVCGSILGNLSSAGGFNGVASDPTGTYIYTCGIFDLTITCGPDTLIATGGGENLFLGRWENCQSRDLGINELKGESEKVKVFPNPFSNSTTISIHNSLSTSHNLELYDLTGQKLKSIEFTGNTYTLSAEGLAKGMYFIRVLDKNNNVVGTSKIVVQ